MMSLLQDGEQYFQEGGQNMPVSIFSARFILLMTLVFSISEVAFAKRYIVKLKKRGDAARMFKQKRGIQKIGLGVLDKTESEMRAFRKDNADKIAYIEPDYTVYAIESSANDQFFVAQDGLRRMNVPLAWDTTKGSSEIIVAVSDTGADLNHPDLINQFWRNPGEISNNGIDDDGNGFIDDTIGWNFSGDNNNPNDQEGHGTHVSGIIGAQANNSIGVAGVNWRVKIMPVQFLDSDGSGSTSDGVSTIIYAVDNGAKVINCSWGGGNPSRALEDAIEYARSKGAIVVAAAGNDGFSNDLNDSYPANFKNQGLISVASSSDRGVLSDFSNFGVKKVHLAAPGSRILSTYRGGDYQRLSGTSMATPMVSGVAALMLSLDSGLSPAQIKNALMSATDFHSRYVKTLAAPGDLNAAKAVRLINGKLQVWPQIINVTSGDSVKFSSYAAQGQVRWSVFPENLGSVSSSGVFTARSSGSGVVNITVEDDSGEQAQTQAIRVNFSSPSNPDPDDPPGADPDPDPEDPPGGGEDPPGGGGCSEANAANGQSGNGPTPWSSVTYLLMFLAYRKFKKIQI
jgi:hypothetical protein